MRPLRSIELRRISRAGCGVGPTVSAARPPEEVARSYREGISFAVTTLAATAPHAALYLDAGHGGWMGFEENAARFAELGVDVYGNWLNHAKCVLADGKRGAIFSANFVHHDFSYLI